MPRSWRRSVAASNGSRGCSRPSWRRCRRTTSAPAATRSTGFPCPSSCREMARRWIASSPFGHEPAPAGTGLHPVAAVLRRHRRLLAAVCAGAAVVVSVSALTPSSSPPPERGGGRGSSLLPAGAGKTLAAGADRVAVAVRLADPAGVLLLGQGAHAEVL